MSNSNAPANRVKGKKQSDRPENLSEKKRHKETPPKSVQAKLDAVAASKKKTPRGPSSVKPRQSPPGYGFKSKATGERAPGPSYKEFLAKNRVRDDERVYFLVHAILSAWKLSAVTDAEANATGIIKVSRRKIEGALRDLKNTRFTKIPSLINDTLTDMDLCKEFGQWVYVEHDSPDWIFIRLPANSTQVVRADISSDRTGQTSAAVTTSTEVLLDDSYLEGDEDEIPENVEYDDEDESNPNEEEEEE